MSMVLESKQHQVSDLLELVCREVQLTDSQYTDSTRSYEAAGAWLIAPDGSLARYAPDVFVQGSRLLGTSIRPREGEEFDVDGVCLLDHGPGSRPDPMRVYDDVRRRLAEHGKYRDMLEPLDRCLRLNYAEGTRFHLDIIPAIPSPLYGELHGELAILIPDREKRGWIATNPLGFAKWFAVRAALNRSYYEQRAVASTVRPLPPPQESGQKAVLQRAAQLFKRRRDVHFGPDDTAPKSILLTALNGYAYEGEELIVDAVTNILDRIASQYHVQWPNVRAVPNPTRRDENLARHWLEGKRHFDNFVEYVDVFREGMRRLMAEDELHRQAKILNELFDPTGLGIVNRAVKSYVERFQNHRLDGNVLLGNSSLHVQTRPSAPAAAAAISTLSAIPRTSFYGD